VKLCLVSAFQDIIKDCRKMRNLPKIFLRSFENVGPGHWCLRPGITYSWYCVAEWWTSC